jgi:hypothetical protein
MHKKQKIVNVLNVVQQEEHLAKQKLTVEERGEQLQENLNKKKLQKHVEHEESNAEHVDQEENHAEVADEVVAKDVDTAEEEAVKHADTAEERDVKVAEVVVKDADIVDMVDARDEDNAEEKEERAANTENHVEASTNRLKRED